MFRTETSYKCLSDFVLEMCDKRIKAFAEHLKKIVDAKVRIIRYSVSGNINKITSYCVWNTSYQSANLKVAITNLSLGL